MISIIVSYLQIYKTKKLSVAAPGPYRYVCTAFAEQYTHEAILRGVLNVNTQKEQ